MKTTKRIIIALFTVLCVLLVMGTFVSCGLLDDDDLDSDSTGRTSSEGRVSGKKNKTVNPEVINALGKPGNSYDYNEDEAVFGRSTTLSFKNNNVVIDRSPVKSRASTADDGTWTIFVYLCGADLESEDGAATSDMEEMLYACTESNIKFVVQTGGATAWQNYGISSSKLQRYVMSIVLTLRLSAQKFVFAGPEGEGRFLRKSCSGAGLCICLIRLQLEVLFCCILPFGQSRSTGKYARLRCCMRRSCSRQYLARNAPVVLSVT